MLRSGGLPYSHTLFTTGETFISSPSTVMGWSPGCVIRSYGKLRGRFNMLLSSRINGNQLPRQIGSTLPIYPLRISNPPNGRICQCPFWSKVWVLFSSAFLLYLTIAYLKPPIFLQSLHHRAHAYTLKFWFWFEAHSSWHRWRVFFQDLKRTTRCRWTSRMNMLPSLISSIKLQPFCSEFWYMDFGA